MNRAFRPIVTLFAVSLLACGTSRDDRDSSPTGKKTTSSTGSTDGGTRADAGTTTGGQSCSVGTDCPYWYCECQGSSTPMNSRSCTNGSCAPASTACPSGCAAVGSTWTGRLLTVSTPDAGTGTTTCMTPGCACVDRTGCTTLTCGCTDGAQLSVRDCYGGYCNSREGACPSACQDSDHGDWDGE